MFGPDQEEKIMVYIGLFMVWFQEFMQADMKLVDGTVCIISTNRSHVGNFYTDRGLYSILMFLRFASALLKPFKITFLHVNHNCGSEKWLESLSVASSWGGNVHREEYKHGPFKNVIYQFFHGSGWWRHHQIWSHAAPIRRLAVASEFWFCHSTNCYTAATSFSPYKLPNTGESSFFKAPILSFSQDDVT